MTPEIDRIKSELQQCTKQAEVNLCYTHHHPRLKELWREGGDMRTMCYQIKYLRDYRILCIQKGW